MAGHPPVRPNRLLAYALIALIAAGCKASGQGEVKSGADAESTDDLAAGGGEGAKAGPSRKTADLPAPSGPATATYPAFEVMPDGSSVVAVYVRGPVQVTEQKVEGRLVYFLNGVGVSARVNRMPLLTQEFPTQVTSVSLEQAAGGANLIVELREPAKGTYKVSEVDGGTMVSVVVPKSRVARSRPRKRRSTRPATRAIRRARTTPRRWRPARPTFLRTRTKRPSAARRSLGVSRSPTSCGRQRWRTRRSRPTSRSA